MTSRDQILPASFRGVPFEVQGASRRDGRRKVVLEIPGRDEPYIQDLGAATQTVTLEAFVIGDDYRERRDALLRAVRARGSGELIHPHYGSRQASVVRAESTENNREMRRARFTLEFVLDAVEVAVVVSAGGAQAVRTSAAALRVAAATSVAGAIDRSPTNVALSAARAASESTSNALGDFVESRSRLLDIALDPRAAATLVDDVRRLSDVVLRRGSDWAFWVQGLQGGLGAFGSSITSRLAAFRALLGFAAELLGLDEADAARAVRVAAAASAVADAAEAAGDVSTGWDSRQEALDARDELLEVTRELQDQADDVTSEGLAGLRAAIVDGVPDPSVDLPELGRYTPGETLPAVVAAARLYGDPARGEEIARRNRVRHPGFLPAREDLEVLIGA
ncbi:MAG: DNA circularization N-terminal domain-containing protein [Planctomycetota bacterium]